MADRTRGRLSGQVRRALREQHQGGQMPFASVLEPEQVERQIEELGGRVRRCVLSPLVVFYGFLAQVLSADQSCRQALAAMMAWLGARGEELPSGDDGPYCKARQRLPEALPQQVARQVGADLHRIAGVGPLLGGRPIKVVDGTTVSMPDTKANQEAYPQARTQKAGLGFPIMRLVVVLSLHCGAVLEAASGPYRGKRTGETALLRTLEESFAPGDVVLGDRYFCSYWQIAMLARRGVDCLLRMHPQRRVDFRKGRRLGREDHVMTWSKPAQPPEWMGRELYDALPQEIEVREVRIRVAVRGFRVKVVVLATTLLDPEAYPVEELGRAFRARWYAEVDLRSIKVAMQMDVLRCKTPAMVRKELGMHLLAYNLIRTVMARAAQGADLEPRQISFTGTMQLVRSFAPAIALLDAESARRMERVMLALLARQIVGDRPDRYEPRAIKRRPKPHKLLQEPRAQARKRMLHTR